MTTTTPTALTGATALPLDHSRATADGAHNHGTAPSHSGARETSRGQRRTSFDLEDFPVPTGREEEWRFTPLAPLAPLLAGRVDGNGVRTTVTPAPGVSVEQVSRDDARLGQAGRPGDRAAAVAWASFDTATVVTLPAATPSEEPSEVTSVLVEGVGDAPTAAHLVVRAETGSSGVVVLDHVGQAALTETVEIVAEPGANLTVVSLQGWASGAVHAASHRIRLDEGATVKHVVVSLGGALVRITPDVELVGERGSVTALGLYYADAGQHLEHRLFVDHAVPDCRSRVTYKGALQGEGARSVWVGDVLIRVEAEGTDTYEENRNLVLTDGARADSVPNLEIETGLIEGAGHASATGRFDDEQLFYLRSRGIPETEARRLVVRGFFADLLAQVGVPEVEERLLEQIELELAAVSTPDVSTPAVSTPAVSVREEDVS
ncbi:MAG: Fe-S cluster assembly protein SufD [Micrococcales bacterium]|nr:Fe-S cluster assembly protein SufD [Micrococcales bacterium]